MELYVSTWPVALLGELSLSSEPGARLPRHLRAYLKSANY